MYQIQLLLPLYDNQGNPLPRDLFAQVRSELVARFGGLTAYTRSPANGLWQDDTGTTVRDDLVIYEIMAKQLDAQWWHDYRRELEQRFQQDALVVRAHPVQLL